MNKLTVILLFPLLLFGEKDSLLKIIYSNSPVLNRTRSASMLSYQFEMAGQKDSAFKYGKLSYILAKQNNDRQGLGDYYNYLGRKNYYVQAYDSAEYYFSKAAQEYQAAGFIRGVASAYNNRATIFSETDQMKKSIREHLRLAAFSRENGLIVSEGDAYSNLGYCYMTISGNDSAIYYFVKASRIYEKNKEIVSLATAYYNLATLNSNIGQYAKGLEHLAKIKEIGKTHQLKPNMNNYIFALQATIYEGLNMPDSANFYVERAIESCIQTEDRLSLCTVYNHKGDLLLKNKRPAEALDYYQRALKISTEINSESNIEQSHNKLGNLFIEQKKFDLAINNYRAALDVSIKMNTAGAIVLNLGGLAKAHSGLGDFKEATFYLDSMVKYKDRLNETARFKSIKEVEAEFETEKKDLQIQKANSELLLKEEENRRKSTLLIAGSVALTFVVLFAIVAIINFIKAKKANTTITRQNTELELKNKEVSEQKLLVEQKQEEIMSSINYAQRIQSAVLTGQDVWGRISKDHFILFKPRDIVSGDFYWAHVFPNGRAVFVLADCTGHGVPGGFMSMMGISFLNEIVIENKIFSAATILNKMRERVIQALDKNGETGQRDGMDAVVCVWNKMNNTLEFSGANNGICVVIAGELIELPGNKMPVGRHTNNDKPFESVTIDLHSGDSLYMYTDGYPDQFGGPKGKKFKYGILNNLLIEISSLPIQEQKRILDEKFLEWKGEQEQTDDVCVIGIKI